METKRIEFELNDRRKATLSHLENHKTLTKQVATQSTIEPYKGLLGATPHITGVVSARVNGKVMRLVYKPTEISCWLLRNAREDSLKNTFDEVQAIVYQEKIYPVHEWVPETATYLVLRPTHVGKILLSAFLNNRPPAIEALILKTTKN